MHAFILAALSSLALAAPSLSTRSSSSSSGSCMCAEDAQKVANNFRDLIGQPFSPSLARQVMAPSFTDYSDSVITLINAGCSGPLTLGDPTFTSRSAFIASQGTQQPIPFEILNLWNTCDTVIMRWRSSAPGTVQPEQEVTGIVALETEKNSDAGSGQPWLIATSYSEFNSGAWLVDVGNFTPSCNSATRRDDTFARRSVNLRNTGRGPLL